MADTTMKVDAETRDRFSAIAKARNTSVRALLAELAIEQENQLKLGVATNAFRDAVSQPGIADAFDRDFGGLPETTRTTRRVA
ncbi:antitoxin MazE7 [Streptomyces phaeochromogenes]|uniref:antitoxin MazE7 n=1 Tax=Streptomyces phaeochromogenes TaxID=1923 RepID=UPI00367C95B9